MISRKIFKANGTENRFLSDFLIRSEQFARPYVFIYDNTLPTDGSGDILEDGTALQVNHNYPDNLWKRGGSVARPEDLVTVDKWAVVDNSILYYKAPPSLSTVWVEVATTSEEFGSTLTQPSVEKAEKAALEAKQHSVDSANSATDSANSAIASANSATASAGSATGAAASAAIAAGVIGQVQGPQGIQGPIGPQGPAGGTGHNGAAGTPGVAGADGQAGVQGAKGDTGLQGPRGNVGPQGIQGTGVNVIGTKPTEAEIRAIPNPAESDAYLAADTGNLLVFGSDHAWHTLDHIQGPAGPAGTQGNAGPAGGVGPKGPKGDAGATGPKGDQGTASTVPGPIGHDGIQGIPGAQGPIGPQGPGKLDLLTDTTLTTPVQGDALVYDPGTGKWINGKVLGMPNETGKNNQSVTNKGVEGDSYWSPLVHNPQDITENITLETGANASIVAPNIADGITITISDGCTLSII